jgi:ankyrin repeat protein
MTFSKSNKVGNCAVAVAAFSVGSVLGLRMDLLADDPVHRQLRFYIQNESDNLEEVRKLIESQPEIVHHVDFVGKAPIVWAALTGNKEMMELLIEYGADVNSQKSGWPPIFSAAHENDIPAMQLLVEKGADVNRIYNRRTPIFTAIEKSNIQAMQLLVEKGANVYHEADDYAGIFILETNLHSWKPILFWKPILNLETSAGVSC